jgi:hypothetical protein
MKKSTLVVAAVSAMAFAATAPAALLQEFLFNDQLGTPIQSTANSVTALQWSDDSSGTDLAGVGTNGSGQYDLTSKNNNELGTVFLDIPDISTGTVYGVIELTWDFDPTLPPAGDEEIIRLSLINSPTLGSSLVTAEVDISRGDDNVVRIFGNGIGTGSMDTSTDVINNTQTPTFIGVVAVNLDSDRLSVSYSDDAGATFTTLDEGALDPARFAQQVRLYMNNDFSADATLIDRVALYDTNPFPGLMPSIPEPASALLVMVSLLHVAVCRRR